MGFIERGPRDSKIMIVGEHPTLAEAQTGTPFSGGAGQVLSHMLSRAGISMSQCFMTNVVHKTAPEGKFENMYKKANLIQYVAGVQRLKQNIQEIKPNLIIGLGNGPLLALTGKKGIDKHRGSIYSSTLVPGQKVICTYSHGFVLKVWQSKAVIEIDLARCAEEAKFPEVVLPVRNHILNPTPSVALKTAGEMLRAEWLAIDIECGYDEKTDKWHLLCVAFSDRPDRSMVLPWVGNINKHIIANLVRSDVKKVYQNGMFDVSVLRENGLEPKNFAWDTMFAHHCMMPEAASGEDEMQILAGKKKFSVLRKGLGFQTSIYTKEQYYKDDGKVSGPIKDWPTFWLYNSKDGAVTREIKDVQAVELQQLGAMESFQTEMAMVEPLMAATRRGMLIDMQFREVLRKDFETKIANFQAALDAGAGRPVNVKSTAAGGDMQWLLYEHLKLPVKTKKRKDGEYTATSDKDAINELAGKYNNPLLHIILKIREYRDLVERYLDARVGPDNRMRCSFDVTGTKSGRLSSRASLDGTGTNLHTIPVRKKEGAQLRQMFLSDPGKVLVSRDYKQGETWFVAYLARCEALIELLNDPTRDIHRETAARMFNIALEDVTFENRYLAKRTGHGCNYGLAGDKLSHMIEEDAATTGIRVTPREAQMLIDKYFMLYPEIKSNFWREVEDAIIRTRFLRTPFGRVRAFYGDMRSAQAKEMVLRDGYSYIPQSGLGDMGNKATARCYNEIELGRPDLGAQFLLSVHDSIIMQCDIGKEAEVAALMEQCMKIPCEIHGRKFIVPTDCQIGYNWNKRSKDKETKLWTMDPKLNPRGLMDYPDWMGIKYGKVA